MNGLCGNCEFMRNGDCHANPPQIVVQNGTVQTRWPHPSPLDWCGRHKAKPVEEKPAAKVEPKKKK